MVFVFQSGHYFCCFEIYSLFFSCTAISCFSLKAEKYKNYRWFCSSVATSNMIIRVIIGITIMCSLLFSFFFFFFYN